MSVEIVIEVQTDPGIEAEVVGTTALEVGYVPLSEASGAIASFIQYWSASLSLKNTIMLKFFAPPWMPDVNCQ